MAPHPSLHQSLKQALQSVPTDKVNPRDFELTSLSTKPFRTHTLFPHAPDPTVSIMRTDYLIVLAEKFEDYRPDTSAWPRPKVTVPVFALEASLYTIPTTSVQLLYISKIDTTGLAPDPAPAAHLTIAFLNHFLQHLPRSIHSLRIHIFARAAREGQYLFPASAENRPNGTGDGARFATKNSSTLDPGVVPTSKRPPAGKRILDDQQLVKWWHKILSRLAIGYHQVAKAKNPLECFYILPGFDQQESLEVLPLSSELKALWNYGHPYNKIGSPFAPTNQHSQETANHQGSDKARVPILSELIPAFNDDPKARFLHSIGNCSTNPSGEPGDWDDAIVERSSSSLESDRNRERTKINQVTADEFWDRMGGRQECCDGRLSAFFVLSLTRSNPNHTYAAAAASSSSSSALLAQSSTKNPTSHIATRHEDPQSVSSSGASGTTKPTHLTESDTTLHKMVPVHRNVWVSLWSYIHNKDYSTLENLTNAYSGWIGNIRCAINSVYVEKYLEKKRRKLEEERNQEKIAGELTEPAGNQNQECTQSEVTPESPNPPTDSKNFGGCFSLVYVDNGLKNDVDRNMNGAQELPSSEHQKRTQVNVLQPRKKPKN
ncbi:uncharacterized protein PGTG_15001 [Puccinia graminis f. sp. tritici CRL 75-36-700-3]|uniref:histone acetyltransferase n=1 Tax=Puccinia graminis f. sp. tritici (strain CRL 75-36-700-3 / race SCCL) TaxID=418459 RepID=E3KY80_PUCGT|nr:uncharacterized protein PGTG_15001 [Puccinia graminis f. sp. tritici CRL 75-36-700-3]EFP89160.2 hypothetical protein PGTG_15001 [Puccinia graminis f. sp. tritici CRL 75-36-700-3]